MQRFVYLISRVSDLSTHNALQIMKSVHAFNQFLFKQFGNLSKIMHEQASLESI